MYASPGAPTVTLGTFSCPVADTMNRDRTTVVACWPGFDGSGPRSTVNQRPVASSNVALMTVVLQRKNCFTLYLSTQRSMYAWSNPTLNANPGVRGTEAAATHLDGRRWSIQLADDVGFERESVLQERDVARTVRVAVLKPRASGLRASLSHLTTTTARKHVE